LKVQGPNNYINLISDPQKLPEADGKKVNSQNTTAKPADKLQISEQAKLLNEGKVSPKDLEAIRAKIDQGFYNSDEVLSKVADAILKEIKGS
jgi:anti-sigma28 factor (negative regulator of flagellin synthesis)